MQPKIRSMLPLAMLVCSPLLIGGTSQRADFNARLLLAHNIERARIGVPALGWDPVLAADARVWAEELAATGRFEHSPDEAGKPLQGENLWAGTPRAFVPEAMVGLWTAEKADYRPGLFPNNSRSGDVEHVGHYTQLIWRNSRRVGCATAVGREEEFLVCRYSEAGNVTGQRAA
ncbi:MAG: CAP domain-containing protein [Sphingomicrobium sp.]